MPREEYQERLTRLREDVLYMSEVVRERLRLGLTALENKDVEMADDVIERDAEVNELYLDLEQDCIDLLALQQPVAGDLRFIAASFKIITDLERIGDLATNLARYAMDARREVYPEVDIQAVGDEVGEMIEASMAAYEESDADACYDIAARDDDVDAHCREISESVVRDLIETQAPEGVEETEALMQDVSRILLTVRDLERVGDHAVNIAARTLYMVEGDDDLIY
ncbi:MAG: phosphate signaling complex protein PhoU [Halobacteriaceae archaeon]